MQEKTKMFLSFIGRFGFSIILLGYLFTKIDIEKTLIVLQAADLRYISLAFVLFFVTIVIILVRWFIFVRALDLSTSTWNVVRFFFIGLFGNLFLPSSIGGDLIKIWGLCKDSSQKVRVVASVLLDRLSGFVSIVVVAFCTFMLGYSFIEEKFLLIPIVIIGLGLGLLGAILFNEKIYSFCCRIFNRIPRIKNGLMQLHYDIVLLKNKKREGLKAIGLSCCSQVIFALTFLLIARAFHQDTPAIYFLVFVPLICVASAFPSIGGLGVREAGAAYLFGKIGMSTGIAVSISLINFLFMVIVGLLGGLVYVATLSSRRVQYRSSDAPVKPRQA